MGGRSKSSSVVSTQTSSIVDSYNRTWTQTLNLADVGNVKINVPEEPTLALDKIGPMLAIAGCAAAMFIVWRK